MYLVLLMLLVLGGLMLMKRGVARKEVSVIVLGAGVWVFTGLLFGSLKFWGEMLWFRELGFRWRFWTVVLSKAGIGIAVAGIGWLVVYLLTLPIPRRATVARVWPELAGTAFGALIGFESWDVVLMFINRVPAGVVDPILDHDVSFYLFALPFYDRLYVLLLALGCISLGSALAAAFLRFSGDDVVVEVPDPGRDYTAAYLSLAVLLFTFAWGQYLNRFHLMNSRLGVVAGPGWTDVHIRMPGFAVVGFVSVLAGLVVLLRPLRKRIAMLMPKRETGRRSGSILAAHARELGGLMVPPAFVAVVWALVLVAVPLLAQWLRVEPNEITMEREYIAHNIRFTRHGFGMGGIEEEEFPVSEELTRDTIDDNRDLMSEVRLWDWRALADVYEQFQEIRLYYTFPDVDIDRYTIGDEYRQVMVSPREMDVGNLSADSQTFVNKRFKYTHGYGLTMSTVREFTEEGLPNLLIKDIPPKSAHPSLEVKRPQIYYGMLTRTPVVVNTEEEEFDYPAGDKNVYTHYEGHGGVQLSSLWRKFIYGWMFDGTRFLLSGYPNSESRMMFRRQVLDRARRVAPFLRFETDPYVVIHEGRLFWIIDAYTVSTRFPYSEPFGAREHIDAVRDRWNRLVRRRVGTQFQGANYVRNSVKLVIDAYEGDMSFYVFDDSDPIIKVWQKVFPELFDSAEEMPDGLRAHVRYPSTLLLTQGLVYTKYHMTDPAVFYNQEDLWVRATEKYYQKVQPVEPYYVMWKLPGSDAPQFVLILPFTPKNKQVMIGWMAAMCDGDNYGRLLAYKFPKEKRVLGPQQMETKIDQDRHLSGQLTLWDQRGSKVIRGNVLAIPIEDTLLYVEPIYLQAETAAYPELRLVAVMHGDNLSYAETFDQAIAGLFDGDVETPEVKPNKTVGDDTLTRADLIQRAQRAFDEYLRLQGEKKFAEAATELSRLQDALERLAGEN